jgi:hypothetical protein
MSDAAALLGHGPAGEVPRHDFRVLLTGPVTAADAAARARSRVDSATPRRDVPSAQWIDSRGNRGGRFGPCHGSQRSISRHGRHGPAPLHPSVPTDTFGTDVKIKIG